MPTKKIRPTITITEQDSNALKELISEGVYLNQGEAIRAGLRLLFRSHGIDIMHGETEG